MNDPRRPRIHVLAGVNGAGKSSIGGATVRREGGDYFNPDEAARAIKARASPLTQADANSEAWHQGVRLLKRAIMERLDFTFDTTLGGCTITRLLIHAAQQRIELHIWYVGLSTLALHIERVQARVSRGGHDIPERDIRRRYEQSRLNLIALLPYLTTLRLYDNSTEADPTAGRPPTLKPVLYMERCRILGPPDLAATPHWAKPIVAAALKLHQS